ncbi:MAG: tyrosine-type recombinase/integrase, partial [Actinomycetia bacterium]|nr:tyrosine-type recombinase/integrase [Actinomycetes bacterium]
SGWLHVGCQVKVANGHLVFSLPKRSKERDVPLSDHVAQILKEHAEKYPPIDVTLPWLLPEGRRVTKRLLFARLDGAGAVRRTDFNTRVWKPALAAAGVIKAPEKGKRHEPSREDGMHALRHFYASVLLAAGENVKALSHYLGHDDPGFTLRVYTHLMPSSDGRARRAVDAMYAAQEGRAATPDGPQAAQAA